MKQVLKNAVTADGNKPYKCLITPRFVLVACFSATCCGYKCEKQIKNVIIKIKIPVASGNGPPESAINELQVSCRVLKKISILNTQSAVGGKTKATAMSGFVPCLRLQR